MLAAGLCVQSGNSDIACVFPRREMEIKGNTLSSPPWEGSQECAHVVGKLGPAAAQFGPGALSANSAFCMRFASVGNTYTLSPAGGINCAHEVGPHGLTAG